MAKWELHTGDCVVLPVISHRSKVFGICFPPPFLFFLCPPLCVAMVSLLPSVLYYSAAGKVEGNHTVDERLQVM